MNMLTKIMTTLLVVVTYTGLLAQKKAEPMQWQKVQVVADGQTDEYPELSRYFSDIKMLYYIGNDDKNLYIVMKTYDEAMMQKLMLSGLEIGLDTTSKKKMRSVLRFPIGKGQDFRRPDDRNEKSQRIPERRPNGLEKGRSQEPDVMFIKGFIAISDGETPLQNPWGIQAKVKIKRGEEFVYEAVIPFKTFFKPTLTAKDKDRVISLTFHLPALERPDGMPQQGPPGGGGHMGGARPGNGQGDRPQRGGERPDFELLTSEKTIKKLFILQFNDN